MGVLFEVTEGSTSWLVVSFYSRTGVLEAPSAVAYQIWDVASEVEVVPETSLTPAATVEITLSKDDNRILDPSLFREARKVIVVATFMGDQQLTQDYVYHIRNLAHRVIPPPN